MKIPCENPKALFDRVFNLLKPLIGLTVIVATTMVGHWMGYQQAETDYGHRPSEIEQLCQAFHELQPKTPTPPPAPQAPNRDAAQVH